MQSQIKEKKCFNKAHPLFMVAIATVFCSLFFSPASMAANIIIIGDMKQPIHLQLVNRLKKERSLAPNSIVTVHPNSIDEDHSALDKADLIISLGLAAARSVNTLSSNTPIFFTLLPKTLAEDFTECLAQSCSQQRGALFLDQPIKRQLNLIKLLFPETTQLSFLYSDFSISAASELNQLAKKSGYSVSSARIESNEQLSRKLATLFQESELFIALPDPLIHNRHTLPQLLLSSYRQRIPVIGFSESYVSAGAIAAVFSSLGDLAKELSDIINLFEKTGRLPNINGYPNRYRVQINRDVARSMNLYTPSPDSLHKGLLALENNS